jgi:photosystem II stability/assembly factor-like uncharacterized protein
VDSRKFLYIKTGTDLYGYLSGKTAMKIVQKILLGILIFICSTHTAEAQWVLTNGPYWDRVYALSYSGSNIFAGTGNGVYLSSNNGDSWKQAHNELSANMVISLAVNGNTIFAGTYGYGILISSNNGTSWTRPRTGLSDNFYVFSIAVSNNTIYTGTDNGIYYSTNNGIDWVPLIDSIPAIKDVVVDSKAVFAGTSGDGIIFTVDGKDWNSGGPENRYIASLLIHNNTIFVGTNGDGLYFSTDNGDSWIQSNQGLANMDVECLMEKDDHIFAGTWSGVFVSDDHGQSWKETSRGLTNAFINSLVTDGNCIFAGTDGSIYRSIDNGANWVEVNNGLTKLAITSLCSNNDTVFAATDKGGVCRSSNNGTLWTAMNLGLPSSTLLIYGINSLVAKGNTIFAGTYEGIFLSTNNGQSWKETQNNLGDKRVSSLAFIGNSIYAGTWGRKVYTSSGDFLSWMAINNGLPLNEEAYVIAGNNHTIFAGTQNSIYLSYDNGAHWAESNSGLPSYPWVQALAVNGDTVFAGTWQGIFVSTNDGKSWEAFNSGLPLNTHVLSFIGKGGLNFVGTDRGAYFSSDNDTSWIPIKKGLSKDSAISELSITRNNLFAGNSSGVWRFPFAPVWRDSLFRFKIETSGDSLNYGYTQLHAPLGMTVSTGGTISWIPAIDSECMDYAHYIVFDDNGKRDTGVILFSVNAINQGAGIKPKVKSKTLLSNNIVINSMSFRTIAIELPEFTIASDLFIFNLSGRLLHQMRGITSRTISWRPPGHLKGSYILMVKNGADRFVKKITLP